MKRGVLVWTCEGCTRGFSGVKRRRERSWVEDVTGKAERRSGGACELGDVYCFYLFHQRQQWDRTPAEKEDFQAHLSRFRQAASRRARPHTHTATRSIAFLSSVNNGSRGSRKTLITAANSASSSTHHPPKIRSCHRLSLGSEGFQRTRARAHTLFSLSGTKNGTFYSLRAALNHHTRRVN